MKGTSPHAIDANRLADKAWTAIAHVVVAIDPVWFFFVGIAERVDTHFADRLNPEDER